jgi:hypothetical protein
LDISNSNLRELQQNIEIHDSPPSKTGLRNIQKSLLNSSALHSEKFTNVVSPLVENRTPLVENNGMHTAGDDGIINTTHNGTAVISFMTSSGYGKETVRTENGETATATMYEIVQLNNPAALGGEGKGIVTAVFQTNSTGMLAPLNGTIAVGIDEISPTNESHITLWKWESGIPLR